jgi:gliding motility-associated-like protein
LKVISRRKHKLRTAYSLFGLMLYLCFSLPAKAQGTWASKASMFLASSRASPVAFSINGKGYICTGDPGTGSGIYLPDVWEYDPVADTWTQKANFGGGNRGYAAGFAIGNFGYMGTGDDGSGTLYNDFWKFDPALNTWTSLPPVGGVQRSEAFAFVINGVGYIGTGKGNAGCLDDLWSFDPVSTNWFQKLTFPGGIRRSIDRAVFVLNNKAYLGTGCDCISFPPVHYNDFWEYDPVANSWSQKANVPGSLRRGALGFVSCSSGYLGLGVDVNGFLQNDLYQYDVTNNTWAPALAFPGILRWDMSTFSIGPDVYVATGATGFLGDLNDLWVFTNKVKPGITPNDTICAGTPVVLTATGGTSYSWNTGDTLASITVTPSASTTYTVRVSGQCATDSAQTTVSVFTTANAAFTYTYEPCTDKCIQFLNHSTNAISYNWDFGDGTTSHVPNPCHYYTDSATYTVTLSIDNSTNCLSVQTASLTYFAYDTTADIFIPSLFSPNGDGKNDRLHFYRRNSFCLNHFEIAIYDRWGEKVFQSANIDDSWDGTYKGELLNSDSFVYYCTLDTQSGIHRELKGSVALVR